MLLALFIVGGFIAAYGCDDGSDDTEDADSDPLPDGTDMDTIADPAPDTDATPDTTPDPTPDMDVTPDTTPDPTPDPDATPDTTPDTSPDIEPDEPSCPEDALCNPWDGTGCSGDTDSCVFDWDCVITRCVPSGDVEAGEECDTSDECVFAAGCSPTFIELL